MSQEAVDECWMRIAGVLRSMFEISTRWRSGKEKLYRGRGSWLEWRRVRKSRKYEDMPRTRESDLEKAARSCKAKDVTVSLQSAVGFDERNKRKSGGILGEGGKVWEMAAASLYDDVLLDSEECHECAADCV